MRLSETARDALLVAAAAVLVFFTNLGGIALWDEDEPKNAVCAREMFERGDWTVPTFNGQLRTDKPILLYWLMLGAYRVWGVTEFAARFWSAALATLTVLLTFDLGRRLGPKRAGLWSGLALAGSLLFGVSARAATPDATLIACTTLGLWAFARRRFSTEGPAPRKLALVDWLAVYVSLALAVLAKGPSGVILPGGVLLVYSLLSEWPLEYRQVPSQPGAPLAWRGWLLHKLTQIVGQIPAAGSTASSALRSIHPLLGLGVVGLVACPWYVAVGLQTDWAWPLGFLGKHNAQRFLEPLENHSGPIAYYIPAILIGLLPWSLWLPASVRWAWTRARAGDRADLFLFCWIGVYVGVFSLAGTKLPSYVLPCYPALALLIGRHLAIAVATACRMDNPVRPHEPANVSSYLPGWPFGALVAVGTLLGGGFLVGTRWLGPEAALVALLGLIPIAGGVAGSMLAGRGRADFAMGSFAAASVLLLAGLFGIAADIVDDRQTPVAFGRAIRDRNGRAGSLDAFRPNLVYYSGGIVIDCPTPKAAAEFLDSTPQAMLIAREDQWPALQPLLPEGVGVLNRERMFLRKFDLLLIGRAEVARPAELTSAASHNESRTETSR